MSGNVLEVRYKVIFRHMESMAIDASTDSDLEEGDIELIKNLLFGFVVAGYSGADFIGSFMQKLLPSNKSVAFGIWRVRVEPSSEFE